MELNVHHGNNLNPVHKSLKRVLCTYQTCLEILHSFPAQQVCDGPGPGRSILPHVVKQQEGLLGYPHFLDTIGNANQD